MNATPAPRAASAPILLGALVGAMVAARFETALGCLAVAIVAAAASGGGRPRSRVLGSLAVGCALAVALNLFLMPGAPLFRVPWTGLVATREGVRAGALLSLRLMGAAAALHGLGAVWPGSRAADECARLFAPLARVGVPVVEARAVFSLALRFAPLLAEEASRIAAVQRLRAGSPPRGLGEHLVRLRATLVPGLTSAIERAEAVGLALEARYDRVRPLPPATPAPWAARSAGLLLAAGSIVWRA